MNDLFTRMKPKYTKIFDRYAKSPAAIERFMETRRGWLISALLWRVIKDEWELAQKKHKIAGNFVKKYLTGVGDRPSPIVMLTRAISEGRISNPSVITNSSLNPTASKIGATPKNKHIIASPIQDRDIDIFYAGLKREKEKVEKFRKGHKVGQYEGLLKATESSINVMIRYYTLTAELPVDMDAIDEKSDVFLQWIDFLGYWLCEGYYDGVLKKYNDDPEGHLIDKEYFLTSGTNLLPENIRNTIFKKLYNILRYLVKVYGQCMIVQQLLDKPDMVLNDKQKEMMEDMPENMQSLYAARNFVLLHTNLLLEMIVVLGLVYNEFDYTIKPVKEFAAIYARLRSATYGDLAYPEPSQQQTIAENVAKALSELEKTDPFPDLEDPKSLEKSLDFSATNDDPLGANETRQIHAGSEIFEPTEGEFLFVKEVDGVQAPSPRYEDGVSPRWYGYRRFTPQADGGLQSPYAELIKRSKTTPPGNSDSYNEDDHTDTQPRLAYSNG